jgi:cob(I)alamin adenosyltransferase
MKIYTKTGDDGNTNLFGGGANARVSKGDARIDAYGNVDELNGYIGWAAVVAQPALAEQLRNVQSDLFTIGSHLAVADGAPLPAVLPALDESIVARLEMQIDAAVATLPPLRNFILPGGSELAARLHIARTVCRRAERRLVRFAADRPVSPTILTFLNRLSDWLFVQARVANQANGVADVSWSGKT